MEKIDLIWKIERSIEFSPSMVATVFLESCEFSYSSWLKALDIELSSIFSFRFVEIFEFWNFFQNICHNSTVWQFFQNNSKTEIDLMSDISTILQERFLMNVWKDYFQSVSNLDFNTLNWVRCQIWCSIRNQWLVKPPVWVVRFSLLVHFIFISPTLSPDRLCWKGGEDLRNFRRFQFRSI